MRIKNKKIYGLVLLGIFTAGVTSGHATDVVSSIENVGNAINDSGDVNKTEVNVSDIDSYDGINSNNNIGTTLAESRIIEKSKPQEDISSKKSLSVAETRTVVGAVPTVVLDRKRKGKGAKPKEDTLSKKGLWLSGISGFVLSAVFSITKKSLNRGKKSESNSGESQETEEINKRQNIDPQGNNSTNQKINVIWPGWRPLAISTSAILVIVVIIFVVYIVKLKHGWKEQLQSLNVAGMISEDKADSILVGKGKSQAEQEDYESTFI